MFKVMITTKHYGAYEKHEFSGALHEHIEDALDELTQAIESESQLPYVTGIRIEEV